MLLIIFTLRHGIIRYFNNLLDVGVAGGVGLCCTVNSVLPFCRNEKSTKSTAVPARIKADLKVFVIAFSIYVSAVLRLCEGGRVSQRAAT